MFRRIHRLQRGDQQVELITAGLGRQGIYTGTGHDERLAALRSGNPYRSFSVIRPGSWRSRFIVIQQRTVITASAVFHMQTGLGISHPVAVPRTFPVPLIRHRTRSATESGSHEILRRIRRIVRFQPDIFHDQRLVGRYLQVIMHISVIFHRSLVLEADSILRG